MRCSFVAACLLLAPLQVGLGQTSFKVSFDKSVRAEPASGRLVVYLIKGGSGVSGAPADSSHWENPQPMFGVDVKDLAPGDAATVDDAATSFPVPIAGLEPGPYLVQAVLDLHRDDSEWKREPGNLFSDTKSVRIGETDGPTTIQITLARKVGVQKLPSAPGVEWFEAKSKLLSEFRGRDVMLRAGVVLPTGYDGGAGRKYAAVYEVPGFGGTHTGASQHAAGRGMMAAEMPGAVLGRNAFWIVLDPESGNGHTLFADSANNGPCGEALVKELIPALEAKYPLAAKAEARLLRGHSSGGWSTLWLALTYPETFGATWSTSPDPVDFHKMQLANIYEAASLYRGPIPAGERPLELAQKQMAGLPSYRMGDDCKMTISQENLMEEVVGPDNTSGQQWDSWFAVWGPRNERGNPSALCDPKTGDIDRAIAEQYRKYDITDLLRTRPEKFAPLLTKRCRIQVGDKDSFYLNEAVLLLKEELGKHGPAGGPGYVKILPGYDHGSIAMAPPFRAIEQEMVDHLKANGLLEAK